MKSVKDQLTDLIGTHCKDETIEVPMDMAVKIVFMLDKLDMIVKAVQSEPYPMIRRGEMW